MKKSVIGIICLFIALSSSAFGQTVPAERNILWDGGFELGYGNNFWGTVYGNQGPVLRSMWSGGVLKLNQRVASRVYILEDGTYTLCAWVKRAPGFEAQESRVSLLLTNFNYYRETQKNLYGKTFPVAAGAGWQRVGWSFEVQGPVRNDFHVEISTGNPAGSVLVDGMSLTRGSVLPDKLPAAAAVEAGFWIPEASGIYLDGEERAAELMIRNHGAARAARVRWEIYDHQEELVKRGEVNETLPASTTVRRKLPLADLPWGGYRLACSVEGEPVLGDGLLALLPRIDQDAFPWFGADATLTQKDFMPRYMKRLGMKVAATCSCAGGISRWSIVNPAEGQYNWQDEVVDAAVEAGLAPVAYLGLKYPPAWVAAKYMKDGQVTDEAGFIKAYTDYVYAFVKHFAGRIKVFQMEDEIGSAYGGAAKDSLLMRIHTAAWQAGQRAARETGQAVSIGIDSTQPDWWDKFLDLVDRNQLDYVSQNTNLRPAWKAQLLNTMRRKGAYPEYLYSMGVGQKSVLRPTSLINVRGGDGNPPGVFAWQLMMNAWLSRPYGTEDPKDGPIVRMNYYDFRTLGQSIYLPSAGKTGIEYDNSPTLGIQMMAMQKYWLSGLRPARDPKQEYTLKGEPTGHERLFIYPFRDREKAVLVLTTVDASDVKAADFNCRWRLSGVDFKAYRPLDIYGQPLKVAADGSAEVRSLPVLFTGLAASGLPGALAAFRELKAEALAGADHHRLEVGRYVLEIDPERPGYLSLLTVDGKKETVILERIVGVPELPKPTVSVNASRVESSAEISFGEAGKLDVNLNPKGVTFSWSRINRQTVPMSQKVRFRLSNEGAGREIVIQEGEKVTAGRLREDYGELVPATAPAPIRLHPEASRVSLRDFAVFDLPGATGQGGFSPKSGFRFKLLGGDGVLEADYTINGYPGGGARGTQSIKLEMRVSQP